MKEGIRLKCIGIERINSLASGTEVLEVRFEDYEDCIIYGSKDEFIECLGKYVEVTFRYEIIGGKETKVVNNMSVLSQVNVLTVDKDFKLFLENVPNNKCTVNFSKMKNNSSLPCAVMYCTNIELEASQRTEWATLTVLDSEYKLSKLRLFRPKDFVTSFVGNYIQADIVLNKYGFKTDEIKLREDLGGNINPLNDISIQYIKNTFAEDTVMIKFLEDSHLLTNLLKYNPEGEIMMGMELVRIAKELSIAQSLVNITKDINIKLLLRLIVLRRLYTLTENTDRIMDKNLKNVLAMSSYPNLISDSDLVNVVHGCRADFVEVDMFHSIQKMCKVIEDAEYTYKYKRRELSNVNI